MGAFGITRRNGVGLRLGARTGTPLPHVMLGLRVLLTEPRNVPLRLLELQDEMLWAGLGVAILW